MPTDLNRLADIIGNGPQISQTVAEAGLSSPNPEENFNRNFRWKPDSTASAPAPVNTPHYTP